MFAVKARLSFDSAEETTLEPFLTHLSTSSG
jgi:hypothetical protein